MSPFSRFTITIESRFNANHHVRLPDGTMESPHGHDWLVRAEFARDTLDENAMVIDFHVAQQYLRKILDRWQHRDLNAAPEFTETYPTAEVIAQRIFIELQVAGLHTVRRVEVTESPGCTAAYHHPA